jgi:hypothetical protein
LHEAFGSGRLSEPKVRDRKESATLEYLRNNVEPGIHINDTESAIDRLADIVVRAILEPQCQQSESILQRLFAPEGDGPEEA